MRLPPTFPSGVDPFLYRRPEIQAQLEQAGFISVFATSNPGEPDRPMPHPSQPGAICGIHVFEKPHRFRSRFLPHHPSLQVDNAVGRVAADLRLRWVLLPDDFAAAPGREPPPVALDPTRSQRFAMMDAVFAVDEAGRNRFRGFGTGRTFPVIEAGEPRLRLGALGNILGGDGAFAGVTGSYVISGFIRPLGGVFLHMLFRLTGDGAPALASQRDLTDLEARVSPDTQASFLTLLGEPDPDRPVEPQLGADGSFLGARVHERLRWLDLDWDRGQNGRQLRTRRQVGPIAGRLSTDLVFNPMDPRRSGGPNAPLPFLTRRTSIEIFDPAKGASGEVLGTLTPDVVEGRAFALPLADAPLPAWRLVGYGPINGGTGLFAGASGMLSVNAAISVLPPAFSNVYVLRLVDPDRRLRAAAQGPRG